MPPAARLTRRTRFRAQYELQRIRTRVALEQGLVQAPAPPADPDDIEEDGAFEITLPQFTQIMRTKLREEDQNAHIRQIFRAFDAKCCGFITLDDLISALREVGLQTPLATATQVFAEVDANQDGRVSFQQFERMLLLHGAPQQQQLLYPGR